MWRKFNDGMFILFKTGLRISEFCGLTLSDIDFEEKQISVNHQLQRTRGMKYIIEDTKTSSGTRIIPMTEEVHECFKRIVENRKKPKKEPVIDGYKGFLFLDKKDMPEVALHWEKHFECMKCREGIKKLGKIFLKLLKESCRKKQELSNLR